MNLAEKKAEVHLFVENADEETTGKLIAFARQLWPDAELNEATTRYEKRIDDFIASGEKGLSGEEMINPVEKDVTMSYCLVVISLAEKDFADALNYYFEKSVSTTEKFVAAVEEAYRKLKENPQFYSYFNNSPKVRSVHLRPFPYPVVLAIHNDEVIIGALHNTNRDPTGILGRFD